MRCCAPRPARRSPEDVSSAVQRELAGRGALPPSVGAWCAMMAKAACAPPAAGRADAAALAPPRVEKLLDGSESLEVGSVRVDGIRVAASAGLVPAALYLDSQHTAALEAMLELSWASSCSSSATRRRQNN